MVVGAVDQDNSPSPSSRTDLVDAWAAGENIECPEEGGISSTKTGTSYAAGLVAGLAAYLLSVDKYQAELQQGGIQSLAENMNQLIVDLAWERTGGLVDTIYNGYSPNDCPYPEIIQKRQQCCKFHECPGLS